MLKGKFCQPKYSFRKLSEWKGSEKRILGKAGKKGNNQKYNTLLIGNKNI